MSKRKIDAIITGADRIALNGDSANKIGTYALSVLAKHHNIPMYILFDKNKNINYILGLNSLKNILIESR